YQSGQFLDPLDPQGKLTNSTWQNGTNSYLPAPFQNQKNHDIFVSILQQQLPWSIPAAQGGGTPFSLDLTPVVVSMGVDGKLGLDPSTLTQDATTNSNDNLYSR